MSEKYTFDCGCSWPILADDLPGQLPLLDFRIEEAPEDCPATWALLGEGRTKGVFQLESSLGRTWTKKLKPENGEHIGALSAILRPGCLKAVDENGVSMTQHYCRRKNGEEPVDSYHPAIDDVLKPTYNVLCYQEQAMLIAQKVAGFNLQQADVLRKAIGKKLPEEMAKVKKMFLEGAAAANVLSKEQAEEVFGWIQKSQRYSFNKSHAICYGLTGYDSAYIKAHFPLQFFASWLYYARNKPDPLTEVRELVHDARLSEIAVLPPDLRAASVHVIPDRAQGTVRFGLADVKGLGGTRAGKAVQAVAAAEEDLGKKLAECDWLEVLLHVLAALSTDVAVLLCECGALDWLGQGRRRLVADYQAFASLTEKERDWLLTKYKEGTRWPDWIHALKALAATKKDGGGCYTIKRVAAVQSLARLLEKPPTSLADSGVWLADREEQFLGVSLTATKLDGCDVALVNSTCRAFLAGGAPAEGYFLLAVQVEDVREVKTKKGKNPGQKMAFLSVADQSGALGDVVAFPDVWALSQGLLAKGSSVILKGERDRREKGSDLFVIQKAFEPLAKKPRDLFPQPQVRGEKSV
jgi:DNA polymerase-3 subunit alpha